MSSELKIDQYGNKFWRNEKGQAHREDGPAKEWNDGDKSWWINGLRHREDGPAIEYANGRKYWYYHGKKIDCQSQEEFERIISLLLFE